MTTSPPGRWSSRWKDIVPSAPGSIARRPDSVDRAAQHGGELIDPLGADAGTVDDLGVAYRGSHGGRRQGEPNRPPRRALLQADQSTLPEGKDRAVWVACEQDPRQPGQMR